MLEPDNGPYAAITATGPAWQTLSRLKKEAEAKARELRLAHYRVAPVCVVEAVR